LKECWPRIIADDADQSNRSASTAIVCGQSIFKTSYPRHPRKSAANNSSLFFGFAARCAEKLRFSDSVKKEKAAPPPSSAAEPHDYLKIGRKSIAFPHTEGQSPNPKPKCLNQTPEVQI
jgi:hypothetical protein